MVLAQTMHTDLLRHLLQALIKGIHSVFQFLWYMQRGCMWGGDWFGGCSKLKQPIVWHLEFWKVIQNMLDKGVLTNSDLKCVGLLSIGWSWKVQLIWSSNTWLNCATTILQWDGCSRCPLWCLWFLYTSSTCWHCNTWYPKSLCWLWCQFLENLTKWQPYHCGP